MPAVWTLTYGGETRTLKAWGIENPRLVTRNQSIDTLSFRVPRADVLADQAFTYGVFVTLKRDGVPEFAGTIVEAAAYADPASGEQGEEYAVRGPMWNLERLTYTQPRAIATVDADVVTGFDNLTTSRVTLNQDTFGNRIANGPAISAILDFAVAQGLPLSRGTIATLVEQPLDEARDINCAEALKRLLQLAPDAVQSCDYSSALPAINVQVRSALAAVTLDLSAGLLIESFRVTPRLDLVPRGVVLHFVKTLTRDDDEGNPHSYDSIETQVAGVPTGEGVVMATIELVRDKSGDFESVPADLANQYYAALLATPYEGSVRLHQFDASDAVKVGNVLNLSNGRAAWAGMNAVVQSVTKSLDTGVTEIEFGPPDHLSPQDFVNMILFNRKNYITAPKTDFPKVQPKDTAAETPNPNAGGNGRDSNTTETVKNNFKSNALKFCDDVTGSEQTIYVLTAPAGGG